MHTSPLRADGHHVPFHVPFCMSSVGGSRYPTVLGSVYVQKTKFVSVFDMRSSHTLTASRLKQPSIKWRHLIQTASQTYLGKVLHKASDIA